MIMGIFVWTILKFILVNLEIVRLFYIFSGLSFNIQSGYFTEVSRMKGTSAATFPIFSPGLCALQ